jgi:hypothetical protein
MSMYVAHLAVLAVLASSTPARGADDPAAPVREAYRIERAKLSKAEVRARFTNLGKPEDIRFDVVREGGGG